MLRNLAILAFAALAYALAMANILYILGFIAGIGVPKAINDGTAAPVWLAVAIDLGLIWLFGLHHSTTARRWFKARWTRVVPPVIERAVYLCMTAVMSAVLVVFWQPVPLTLWQIEAPLAVWLIRGLFALVVVGMVATTFQLGHFRFFGLAQAWERFQGYRPAPGGFCSRWLYALVRHPISLGWMLLPWLVPHMTVGQAVFGLGVAVYVLAATPHEEADLEAELGDTYRRYRRRVPAFLPGLRRAVPEILSEADDGIW